MKLTVTTMSDELFVFDVSEDLELENFKVLCELETSIPARELLLIFSGRPLLDNAASLSSYGIRDGDVLVVQHLQGVSGQTASGSHATGSRPAAGAPQIDFSQVQLPGAGQPQGYGSMSEDPATLRELLLSSPHDVALLKERNPQLAEALLSGNLEKFTEVLRKQQQERADRDRERLRLFSADPFDADAQRQIAEEIRLKNVEHNMETAMEHSPESFGQVTMLYIDCSVNGHPVKAFVDSGAQMTIMSQACADRCNIMRLIDTRWAGLAKGVGTQKIIGRVHLCQIQIGPVYLQCSFSILEDQPMDMLLGLDMLKRHQCIVDLKHNELVIGTTDTHTPFLCEADLPENARLNRTSSEAMLIDEDRQLAEVLAQSEREIEASTSHSAPRPAQPLPSASSSSSQSRPQQQQQPTFPESHISRLVSYGFAREVVIEELRNANGNVEAALAALLAKSLMMP